MDVGHGQFTEAHAPYPFGEVGWSGELPGSLFDGDLPKADRGQEDVRVVPKPVEELLTEGGITGDGPQHHVGVQQQGHSPIPKSAAISALVWGESQSPDRSNCPEREPTAVRLARRTNGTTFATGVPARSMMISSPRSTRSIMRDRWVLASCML